MENHTIVKLNAIAKERVIRDYYKLRNVELIRVLEVTKLVEQKSNIFDEPIPNDSTPVLQPTTWRPSNNTTKVKQNIKNFAAKIMQNTKIFLYYGYANDYRFW